jgi:hypothetical protein
MTTPLETQIPSWVVSLKTLHKFDCIDGGAPIAALIQATNENPYGTF